MRPSLHNRHGVDYWSLSTEHHVPENSSLECLPFKPQTQRTRGSIRVEFIDEEHTGQIHDIGTHLSKPWWDSTFPKCPVSFEDFKASTVRVISTNFGLVTGLLPPPRR